MSVVNKHVAHEGGKGLPGEDLRGSLPLQLPVLSIGIKNPVNNETNEEEGGSLSVLVVTPASKMSAKSIRNVNKSQQSVSKNTPRGKGSLTHLPRGHGKRR